MSWMTPEYIMRIFEEEEGLKLTAKEINERLRNELTDSALNRHVRRLTGWRFGYALKRHLEKGEYIYYKSKN